MTRNNVGQVLLIILLVTVVGVTVGLSLVARTITDVKISSQVAESSKAFSAAESGIETALKSGQNGSISLGGGATANYSVSTIGGTNPVTFANTAIGNVQTLWLVNHQTDGTITLPPTSNDYAGQNIDVCWGPSSAPYYAGLEVTLLYYGGSTYKISKVALDSAGRGGFSNSNIITGSSLCGAGQTNFKKTLNFASDFQADPASNKLIALRLNPVYSATDIVVRPNGAGASLPSQGNQVTSTGKTTAGVVRRLTVLQGYNVPPPIFDYSLFTNQ